MRIAQLLNPKIDQSALLTKNNQAVRIGAEIVAVGIWSFWGGFNIALVSIFAFSGFEFLYARSRSLIRRNHLVRGRLVFVICTLISSIYWSGLAIYGWQTGYPILKIASPLILFTLLIESASFAGRDGVTALIYSPSPAIALLVELSLLNHFNGVECAAVALVLALAYANLISSSLHGMASARALEQAEREARAASRAKTDFLATMSHEIRTPLNGILGLAQVMEREPLSDAQRRRLELILKSGASLREIVDDALDISKIEAGKLQINLTTFDLSRCLNEICDTFEPIIFGKNIFFERQIDASCEGHFEGDRARLKQILNNLLSNAVKFTPAGAIKLAAQWSDDRLKVEVSDTGIGMGADAKASLFRRYFQAGAASDTSFGGTGLGLSICKELALLMGGDITVETAPGEGSKFAVSLRLPKREAVELERPAPHNEDDCQAARQMRVLVAEDNPINKVVIATLLDQLGVESEICSNGSEAIAAASSDFWDLILMDIQMPVLDGVAAATAIRAEERKRGREHIPIFALTGGVMPQQLEDCAAAGMNGYLSKPIVLTELLATLNSVVKEAA